jgi:hypothetical protein
MDFTAAARELKVKTIDVYRFASRNPRVLDDLFGAELDRISKSVAWFDQALSGEHGINGALDASKFVLKNSPEARQVGWGAPDATVNLVRPASPPRIVIRGPPGRRTRGPPSQDRWNYLSET